MSDICDQYHLHSSLFYRWQKAFFEKGHLAFQASNDSATSKLEKKVSKLEQKLTQKNEVLSELMEEHIKLKKNLGEIWVTWQCLQAVRGPQRREALPSKV